MKNMKKTLLIVAAAFLAACASTKGSRKTGSESGTPAANSGAAEAAPAIPPSEVTEASLRTGGFESRSDLKTVHFDYDSAKLTDDTLATLKANAEVLKADESLTVEVTGNCDERGTVAYNLA